LIETFIEGLRSDIQREFKTYRSRSMTAVISFARRKEERLGEGNRQIIKVTDKPTAGKGSSFSSLACKPPITNESFVRKVNVL